MDVLQWIASYWVTWLCALIAGGVILFAKHYIKLQKKQFEDILEEREAATKEAVISSLKERMDLFEASSTNEDIRFNGEIEQLSNEVKDLRIGILSIQRKQFIDECKKLLEAGHSISLAEYEQIEEDHLAYKALGGNHNGDALHERVVDKVKTQINAINEEE